MTYVPDLDVVATSSYDKNVYMWATEGEDPEKGTKMGSLVLGNKATAPDAELDKETAKYRARWHTKVDKETRYREQLLEAEEIWERVSKMDYEKMKREQLERQRKKEGREQEERAETFQKQKDMAQQALHKRNANQVSQNKEKNLQDMDEEEQARVMLTR